MPGRLSPLALIAIFCAILASSDSVSARDDSRNAATWYQRAIDAKDDLTREEWDLLGDLRVEAAPTDEVRRIVRKGSTIIQLCRRGSTRQYCDYNLNYDDGFELLLPHLGTLRSIARLVRTAAMVRLHDGDSAGATELLGILYRMSDHFTDDRTLISSLVGQAVLNYNDRGIQTAIDRAALRPADAAALLRNLKPLHTDDPFKVTDAVAMEQEMVVGWLDERYGQEDGGMAKMMEEVTWKELSPDEALAFEEMSADSFQDELVLYDDAMTRAGEIFAMTDPEAATAAMEEFDTAIEDGEYGIIALTIMPALNKMLERVFEARQDIDDRVTLLSDLATGVKTPLDEADASYLYIEAIRLIRALPDERIDLIMRADADPAMAIDEQEAARTLTDLAPIIDVLKQATTRRRCEFAHAQAYFEIPVAQSYHDGMRDVFRVLHLASVLQMRDAEHATAAELLTATLTVVRHLSDDPQILSALLADEGFTRTERLIRDGISVERLDIDGVKRLHDEVRRIGRGDTFGYAAALSSARDLAASIVMYAIRDTPKEQLPREPIAAVFERLSADQVFFYMALRDALRRAADPASSLSDEQLTRLGDVMSAERLTSVRRLVPQLAPIVATHDYAFLLDPQLPAIANLDQRRRQCASRVRSLTRLLGDLVKTDSDANSDDPAARNTDDSLE